jgi:hypothetical protein
MIRRILTAATALVLVALGPAASHAGVVNPDISVLGQPFMRWTDDRADSSPKRIRLDQGEVEMVFDSYLNPYARGTFVTSLGTDGLDLEEGYFTLVRGLPAGLQLKGGKYRVNFGKLNPMHYGQPPIMPSTLGNSAPMAEGSPFSLFITGSEILRSRAPLGGQSLNRDMEQEVQCS